MSTEYYILEHPTRGIVTDLPGHRDEKYHFAWSTLRSDERNERFFSIDRVRLHRDRVNDQVGGDVQIRKSPEAPGYGWDIVQ